MWNFEWCLRYTPSVDDPFVTGQQPVVLEGPAPNSTEAMTHPDTLIWFPICWQACLIGSLRRFDEGTLELLRPCWLMRAGSSNGQVRDT